MCSIVPAVKLSSLSRCRFFKQQADKCSTSTLASLWGLYPLDVYSPRTTGSLPHSSFEFWTGRAQFPNSGLPSSRNVWECGCLFHFKLVEPPSYQAAIKISGCKQNGKSSIFSSSPKKKMVQSCTQAHTPMYAGVSSCRAIKVCEKVVSHCWKCVYREVQIFH